MRILLTTLLLLPASLAYSQSAPLTPTGDLGMHTVPVGVPAVYSGSFPGGRTLSVPTNYSVSVFYAGTLSKPRFMAFSPAGVLHVSDMSAGKVFALPDANNDGVADALIEAASGFAGNHDVKFYKGAMYVAERNRIMKCTDTDADGVYETKTIFINNIANNETGGHVTRTIEFDAANQKVYVSVGSSCNVCRENHRAIIEQYNEDGTGRRVFSTGVRNAVGMDLHPVTNRLWANNNGSDNQGNEIPPEWIDIVRDGGFYGQPLAYGNGVWFNFTAHPDYQALLPITAADSANVSKMLMPAALIRAHSAPMALEFLNSGFGGTMQYGFLTALRGSWNTTNPPAFRGFKVIYGHLASAQDTTVDYVADFCSGFLTDTIAKTYWGRPVGIATDATGKVYISSDEGSKFVLVLTPDQPTGVNGLNKSNAKISKAYPNPAKSSLTLPLSLKQTSQVSVSLYDLTGREVSRFFDRKLSSGDQNLMLNLNDIAAGNYLLKVTVDAVQYAQKLSIQ